jgi:hypothetical protein
MFGGDSALSIVVRARNEASKTLKEVQGDVDGMGRHVESGGGKMGAALGVARAGLLATGAAAVAFGGLSVKSFMESQEATAQLNAVLASTKGIAGVTADEATKLATSLQGVTRFADETIMQGQNMLLTFTNIGKDVFPAATETMLNMSQALGQDVKSSAIQLGKALNNPIEGVTALRRVGVALTDQQLEQIKTMQEAGDIAGAQGVILKELETEFGGAAKAAGQTFGGQLDILKNKIGDQMEVVGEWIVNGLMKLVDWIGKVWDKFDGFKGVLDGVKGAFQGAFEAVRLLITGDFRGGLFGLSEDSSTVDWLFKLRDTLILVGQTVWGYMKGAFETLKGVLDFLMPSLKALWTTLSTELFPALMNLWNTISPVLIPVLKFLAAVLGVVIVAAIWLVINVLNVIIDIIGKVVGVFIWLWNAVKTAIDFIVGYFQFWWGVYSAIFNFMWNLAVTIWNAIFGFIRGVINGIISVIQGIIGVVSNVFNGAANIVRSVWGGIVGFFSGIVGGIGNALGGVAGAIKAPFSSAFNGVKDLWNNTLGRISFKVPDWVPGIGGKGWSFPKFQAGIENFGGGLAYVHKGEVLANLPAGTDVIPRGRADQMFGNNGGSQRPITVNVYPQTAEAVREVFRQIDNDTILGNKGLTPIRGGAL